MSTEDFDDPVAAYDRLAPEYAAYRRKRETYLRSVENAIIHRIPSGPQSLLDIGAGDGARASRIASAAGISRVVLLEPSASMAAPAGNATEIWRVRAEDLNPHAVPDRFDVITCLWNVLGHVGCEAARIRVLKTAGMLLSANGLFFFDVNHRYNARSYGLTATCARWLEDSLLRNSRNGDVTATWRIGQTRISTYGHVFTDREILRLARRADLELEKRIVIDYGNGSLHEFSWLGNLLYIFRRSSRIDSSKAPVTR